MPKSGDKFSSTQEFLSQGAILRMLTSFGIKKKTLAQWLGCEASTISRAINNNTLLRTITMNDMFERIFESNLPQEMGLSKEDVLNVYIVPYLKKSEFYFPSMDERISHGYDVFTRTLLSLATFELTLSRDTSEKSLIDDGYFNMIRRKVIMTHSDLYCVLDSENQIKLERLCSFYDSLVSWYRTQIDSVLSLRDVLSREFPDEDDDFDLKDTAENSDDEQ